MNRKLLASAICASLFVAATAYAQDTSAPAPQAQDQSSTTQANTAQQKNNEAKTLETVTVTGSLLKRPEYQEIAPTQTVNIEANIAAGQVTIADFLQSSAAIAGSTQINTQFGGFVIDGGTGVQTVSLRGLGANRTLVLLDGQRPGPAGTRGAVSGFDLNVVPQVILNRVEIVKDGSSSLYGSDAVAGVVNLITKKRLDKTEMSFGVYAPEHGGGEKYLASIGTGWNFARGNVTFAAEVTREQALKRGDRDFLSCGNDIIHGPDGQSIDRQDHSILQGTSLAGCNNLLINTILGATSKDRNRYVPSPSGITKGPFPGYQPRVNTTYANSPQASYQDVLNFANYGEQYAIDRQTRGTLYGAASFNFGPVAWDTQLLLNQRKTHDFRWRQFFPLVANPGNGFLYQPVMLFPFPSDVNVDYIYGATKFAGEFTPSGSWTWQVNGTYTRSDGDYSWLGIDVEKSGDLGNPLNQAPLPPVNYFDPGYLSGSNVQGLVNAVGQRYQGNTVYDQQTVNAIVNGNLFELPAGPITSAFGAEYRHFSIDDKPPPASWGLTGAQQTKGSDNVKEVFGEIGVPILKGLPAVDSLALDLSARQFKYSSVGDSSHVWKYGFNWQIVPSFRLRGSMGTSYRAPGLFELYLGNQSGFLGQASIDPCVDWGQSNNRFLRSNCAAAGIPGDYAGTGSSATIFTGGGKGFLKPETSRAKTLGFVLSPTFTNLNVAVDYFDYRIRGEIDSLSASDILSGCYSAPVYPNAFCGLFNRNPSNANVDPNRITDVHSVYININSERTRGYDLQMNYAQDFGFGSVRADAQLTYTMEDTVQLFDSAEEGGFATSNFVGYIGRPRMVGLFDASLKRGDWTYAWQGIYTSATSNKDLVPVNPYQGIPDATYIIRMGGQLRHSLSVGYDAGNIGVIFGVRNVFDQTPGVMSTGTATRIGNVPLVATQYDWYGRTYFARLNIKL